MILPLYSAFEKFDFSLVEAARDLGASRFAAFCKVLLPLNVKPIAAGCTLVFMPALGEFIIPDLLGGAKVMLIGNLITEQFLKSRDWPFGAALSVGLLIAMLLPLLVRLRGRA
jgi:spermidine/putrescine transport system permease protein